jgi:hypothetical protein
MKYEELRLNLKPLYQLSKDERVCQVCSGLGDFHSLADILIFFSSTFSSDPQPLPPIIRHSFKHNLKIGLSVELDTISFVEADVLPFIVKSPPTFQGRCGGMAGAQME